MIENLAQAYNLLGISSNSSLAEVTKAYRRLAKRYHPDSNPENHARSSEMMMRLNEAYETIKENYWNMDSVHQLQNKTYDKIIKTWYERAREKEIQKQRAEDEKRRRKNEALQKFWERVTLEQSYELEDKKAHRLVERYAYRLVSYFYVKNFHNSLVIRRPIIEREFNLYVEKFKQYMKKIRLLRASCRSKKYRFKTAHIYKFLKSFIIDAVTEVPAGVERRASAMDAFQTAGRNLQKFIGDFFTSYNHKGKKATETIIKLLTELEYFLKSYPDSPLTQYAQMKIDILEKMFKAFIKED